MKILFVISLIAISIFGIYWAFTIPAVGGPVTMGGMFLEFYLVDMVFGISKKS